MKTIIVHTPFRLNLGGGVWKEFAAGQHHVDDAIADHWYTQAHANPLDKKAVAAAEKAAAEKAAKEKAEQEAAAKAEADRLAAEEEAKKKAAGSGDKK